MRQTTQHSMRLLLVLMAALCFGTAHAQQGQTAFFHYGGDDYFQAFMTSEVDSITFSNIGLDGIEYNNPVVQEVWTPDSVYRIPIAGIDSIALHAPTPRYAEATFPITDDHLPYLVAVDDLNITFSSSTPESMLPTVGQVLVADTWEGLMEDGFAGRVIQRRQTSSGIEFVCEEVSLGDIFESLVLVTRCVTSEDAEAKPRNLLPPKSLLSGEIDYPEETVTIEPFTISVGYEDGKGKESPIKFEYTPSLIIKHEFHIVKDEPAKAHVTLTFKHDFELKGKHKLELLPENIRKPHEWLCKPIKVPIPFVKVIKLYFQFGAFLDANAELDFDFTLPATLSHTFGIDYDEEREERGEEALQLIAECDGGIDNEKANVALTLKGSFATGLAAVIGVQLVHKRLCSVEADFHLGPKISGELSLNANDIGEDANAYRLFKDTKLSLDAYLSVSGKYQVWGRQVQLAKRGTWKGAKWKNLDDTLIEGSMELDLPLFVWYLLPEFDLPDVRKCTAQSAWCTLYPKRELLLPVDLGVKFTEYGTDNVIERDYGRFRSEKGLAKNEELCGQPYVQTKVDGLKENTIYKVTPTVTLLGKKMNAIPTTDYGTSPHVYLSTDQVEVYRSQTVTVDIVGGSGDYVVDDGGGSIARVVSLTPAKGSKKTSLEIFGTEIGDTVIRVSDRQNPTAYANIHVTVVAESEWGNLDDVPGSDL